MSDIFETYKYWLSNGLESNVTREKDCVKEDFTAEICNSPSMQMDALINGIKQPISAIRKRKSPTKCQISLMPNDDISIGDVVRVFNENWICMTKSVDEYSMVCGEIWLCNHTFKYVGFNGEIIETPGIIDDGSYSKGEDKNIQLTKNYYICYVPKSEETNSITVDKRLALDVIYDINGNKILEVGKVVWLDTKTKNFGEGSHLLVFGLSDDVYNQAKDNVDMLICDYIKNNEVIETNNAQTDNYLIISGRDKLRIGTSRTYTATTNNGEQIPNMSWVITPDLKGIIAQPESDKCVVNVKLNTELVGRVVRLQCRDDDGVYDSAIKEVEVVSVG